MKITDLQSSIVTPKKEDVKLVISSLASSSDAVTQMNTELLTPYEGQPFKPYSEEKLLELAEDIKINGVLSPIIVRPVENGRYQILAGHNRTNASKLVGLTTVPAIIKPCDDITAMLIVVNTNLNQRQELLPSEKAFAYKMQLEAIKHQGITSCQVGTNLRSDDLLAENSSDSARQIQRYIRLTYLIKSLLDMVDNNKFPFMVGVNLSYLSESNQIELYNFILEAKPKISLRKSEELKELNYNEDFTSEMLDDLFFPDSDVEVSPEKRKYKVELNQTQYKTVAMCIKSQKQSIEPNVFQEIIKIFESI